MDSDLCTRSVASANTLGPAPDDSTTYREWRKVHHFEVYWPRESTEAAPIQALFRNRYLMHPSILGIIETGSPGDTNVWVAHTLALRGQFSSGAPDLMYAGLTSSSASSIAFLGSLFSSIRFGRLSSIPEPCSAAKVIPCIVAVVSLSIIVVCSRTPINLSFRGCVVMPWLEWCPDPQQPDAQWVKIFHPGSWTPHEEHDAPPPPHTYREWREF